MVLFAFSFLLLRRGCRVCGDHRIMLSPVLLFFCFANFRLAKPCARALALACPAVVPPAGLGRLASAAPAARFFDCCPRAPHLGFFGCSHRRAPTYGFLSHWPLRPPRSRLPGTPPHARAFFLHPRLPWLWCDLSAVWPV